MQMQMIVTFSVARFVSGLEDDMRVFVPGLLNSLDSERAKSLLNQESGPASLSSVQARLALCLYLLSTFRINECRFIFSMACAILTSIGLHRKTRAETKVDLTTIELRKRTFWCAYVLDGYLSVMLGCPRMLRDQDIDQHFPRNIDDQDLLSAESPGRASSTWQS